MWFILSGICIQLIFLISIFDIHFHSPVIHGVTPHASPITSPAKRLVLISADGLRFDTFLGHGNGRYEPNAPFLRSVIATRGKWGISNTRVPTESRPGHVALIAGLYEDPSAVFKGWKENPVEFDSVFNQSRYTFGWGSPDILPMFAKGAKRNVMTHTYLSENEQFTGHDAYKLDEWVFERFERFIKAAPHNHTLKAMLNETQIVFFLHLLGLDTNGHTNKPHSSLYQDNLHYVDTGIAKLEKLVNDYFQDNNTVFIFTSDHGMTDWGSHGAGHPTETQTPIVAWGAGISTKDIDPEHWDTRRDDVEQADIAPLMAALLGIPFPVNSVGKLPLAYLSDENIKWKAQAALTNARQLRSSFEALHDRQKSRSISWRFRPFQPLSESDRLGENYIQQIENYLRSGYYNESIRESMELMDLCLRGADYFYRYDQFQLKSCITLAYVGWAGVLVIFLIQDRLVGRVSQKKKKQKVLLVDQILFALSILVFIVLTVERAPVLYYAYHLLPLLMCWYSLRQISVLRSIRIRLRYWVWIGFLIVGIELLVAGFFHRWFLSIGLCFLALWPHGSHQPTKSRHHETYRILWTLACIALAFFPVLPPVGKHSLPILVDVGGMVLTIMAFWSSLVMHHDRDRTILVCYTIAIPITLYVRHSVSDSLVQGQGLPFLEQTLSWMLLMMPLSLPFIGPSKVWPRLIGIALTLTPSFLLLSLSYEPLFYAVLLLTLAIWIQLESLVGSATSSPSPWHQLRRSYFFLFLTLLSFFGLGNLASLNSFDPSSVRCFVTTFSPFTMGALLLWKITVPFIAVSSALWAITIEHQVSMKGMYLMILLLSSAMAVQFFHWVTSRGSWLDIGTSISHYVIVQSMVLFVMLLRSVVQFLTHGPIYFHRTGSKYDKD